MLQIIADLIRVRITNDVRASGWYVIILDQTSDISRTEQVSLCLSFALFWTKKKAFMGFYSTKSTEGEVLYELMKSAITELNLHLRNIVGKHSMGQLIWTVYTRDSQQEWQSARSPLAIYVHCTVYADMCSTSPLGYCDTDWTTAKRFVDYPGSLQLLRSKCQTTRTV